MKRPSVFKTAQIFILLFPSFFLTDIPVQGKGWGQNIKEKERQSDSLFKVYKQQLEMAISEGNSSGMARKHIELAKLYHEYGLLTAALEQYNQALRLLDNRDRKDTSYVLLNNGIGRIHLSMDYYDLAEQYFNEAIKAADHLSYTRGKAVSRGYLGSCYEKRGNYLKALKYQKEGLGLFELLGDGRGIATANENIGSIYEDLAQYERANTYFMKAYQYLKGSDSGAEANLLNNLGDICRKKGDYGQALHYSAQALEVAGKVNDKHQIESAHKDLSKTYALMGAYKEAHQHLVESEEYNKSLLRDQNSRQLNFLQIAYDMEKKEAQIRLLEEQNKVNKAYQKLWVLALIAGTTILAILYGYHDKRRKARLKLEEYQQRALKTELEKKAIEEKNLQQDVLVKTAALSKYSLHLSQKNKILQEVSSTLKSIADRKNTDYRSKVKELAKGIDLNLQQEKEWDEFVSFFEEIHPGFIKKLSSLSKKGLSPAELRLGMLLRLNLSSKEIAAILRVTPDSVRVARHRLRKKLPINPKEELVNFMIEL